MLGCLQAPLVMDVKVLIGGAVIFLSVGSGFLNFVLSWLRSVGLYLIL